MPKRTSSGQDGLPRLAGAAGSAAEQGLSMDPAAGEKRRAPDQCASSFCIGPAQDTGAALFGYFLAL
jgi:hypothetical protein